MRLSPVEMHAMQSPVRRWSQKHVELRAFTRMLSEAGIDLRGKRILEAGCGSGYGLSLLSERFAPSRLAGFDLMPEQIELARKRMRPGGPSVELAVGDITRVAHEDASFDAVFVFGILHHVSAWRDALKELHRVLAPGGVLLVEELSGRFIDFSDRFLFTEHPRDVRLRWDDLRAGLRGAGFEIVAERRLALELARSFLARK
ncbi:MAG: class I SAM-dependent methyltransferase [Sandaracinaceae bacterium]|nr:class I SAM-dependent methyltransferase [Sandaracinaceae bacterium]